MGNLCIRLFRQNIASQTLFFSPDLTCVRYFAVFREQEYDITSTFRQTRTAQQIA